MITYSERWVALYPGASIGVLAMSGLANPKGHAAIEGRKQELVADLRAQYAGFDRARFKSIPRVKAYDDYYARFGKSYHVLLQLESVVLKAKPLPTVGALVDVMFAAELRNIMLTAGHDFDSVSLPLTLDVATGTEIYTLYNGKDQLLKADDMFVRDGLGVVSSILSGPDQRTRIHDGTTRALYVVYAPPGVEPNAVRSHLEEIRDGVSTAAPAPVVEFLEVQTAPTPK